MTSTIQTFDYTTNLEQAVLWQYSNATNLQSLISQKQTWYNTNQTAFWQNWYTNVFNLATANMFGLSVWSVILGQPITLPSSAAPQTQPSFGFGAYNYNFTNGNFTNYNGSVYTFPLQYARLILQLRYYQLTSSGTVPEINRMLATLFASFGVCYVLDTLHMKMEYVFEFPLTYELLLIFQNFDLLPRPAGVEIIINQGTVPRFGLGIYNKNFTNGNFAGNIIGA